MEKYRYALKKLAYLLSFDIVTVSKQEVEAITSYTDSSHLLSSHNLQEQLISGASQQEVPYIFIDKFQVCFAGIKNDDSYVLMGPLSLTLLSDYELRRFYKHYHLQAIEPKAFPRYPIAKVLDAVSLVANIVTQQEYTNDELLSLNHFFEKDSVMDEKEKNRFVLEAVDDETQHHSFQEEKNLLEQIKIGNLEKALKLSRKLDSQVGRMAEKEEDHWRTLAIVTITLSTRAAIDGGLKPSLAYHISDFYLQQINQSHQISDFIKYRNHAIEDLVKNVLKHQKIRSKSTYTEQAKQYIEKHYREKIYLEDIAEALTITPSYLSRLFKKETGRTIQDYIVETRVEYASNLLLFSNESIITIAEYVHFSSQSYFGKMFKKYKHMTPKEYRDRYKAKETY